MEGNKGFVLDFTGAHHMTSLHLLHTSMFARCLNGTIIFRHAYSTLPSSNAQRNTIYALSTPPGKGGVAIVRVSGQGALEVWRRMVKCHKEGRNEEPMPWKLHRCRIVHPEKETLIDDGLAVYFRGELSLQNLCLPLNKARLL